MQEAAKAAAEPISQLRPGIRPSVVATVILVIAADILILSVQPGLGWFVFATSLAGVVAANAIGRSVRSALIALAVGTAAALPLIEAPTIVGAVVAFAGLCLAALIAGDLSPRAMDAVPGVLLRFVPVMPLRLATDALALFGARSQSGGMKMKALARRLTGWIVPLVFAVIFLGLFLAANPVMDLVAEVGFGTLKVPDPVRVILWLIFAVAIWALVRPRLAALPPAASGDRAAAVAIADSRLFGRATITRSLVAFNAIFAVQTLMDLAYLWGGATLPAGMTYADFAHRGAAPLIVTALLAAAFVLAAMRPNGPGIGSPLIRGLVYAWIAQNVLLCISAMFRLGLYVEAYTLTEFRVVAGIWMGLVAVGLVLIFLRIALRRSNGWLIAANIISLTVALSVAAAIDVRGQIAWFNVDHSHELSGEGVALDIGYFRDLGPTAIPALDAFIAAVPASEEAQLMRAGLVARWTERDAGDWRSWSFRDARLSAYLDGAPPTDDNLPVTPQ